jgi:hypothetical protein
LPVIRNAVLHLFHTYSSLSVMYKNELPKHLGSARKIEGSQNIVL